MTAPAAPDGWERLVVENYSLISPLARRYTQLGLFEFEDARGYGAIGLIRAAKRFDPARGIKFSTFAYRVIQQSIIDAVRRQKLPRDGRGYDVSIDRFAPGELDDQRSMQTLDSYAELDLRVALAALTRDQRLVIHLRYQLEQPYPSIAETLGLPLTRVREIHASALACLRDTIGGER